MHKVYLATLLIAVCGCGLAQEASVRGTVEVKHRTGSESGNADVIVWLTPSHSNGTVAPGPTVRLVQKNKKFTPHVLAVTSGTQIEFPNQDPFFHDVFSIYHGKPFDLGLYESGAVRKVQFSQPGVSYIFCNIHPQMNAAVVVLRTPYFAVTGSDGSFRMSHVPAGQYRIEFWYEFAAESELESLSRDLQVASGENVLDAIAVHSSDAPKDHLNKYGEDYSPSKTDKY